MVDQLIHRWLKIPYTLHVRYVRRPRNPRATLLFIHGIGNTGAAWDGVIDKLPDDVRIITIDLLGFGKSPNPKWAVYDAKTQARSVLATYLKLRIVSPVIVIGHSLGALVAIEMAKRYPILTKSLVLCSPPLYDISDVPRGFRPKKDELLRKVFQSVRRWPNNFVTLSSIAMKYNLIDKSFGVTSQNVDTYMAALESTIINQSSYADAHELKMPIRIIRGIIDPFVVKGNLRKLVKANPNINMSTVIASHDLRGRFIDAVVSVIGQQLKSTSKNGIKVIDE